MTKHRVDRPDMILAVIEEFTAEYGYAPTVREIMVRADLRSTSAVHYHLRRLAKAGRITYQPSLARSLRVTGASESVLAEDLLRLVMFDPGVGSLAADLQDAIGRYFASPRRNAA